MDSLAPAYAALDDCDAALDKLDKTCCIPERSPRMAALAESLESARRQLGEAVADPATADATFARLEDAGAQVGSLQVSCCAPSRMPQYERLLDGLNVVQRTLASALGEGH